MQKQPFSWHILAVGLAINLPPALIIRLGMVAPPFWGILLAFGSLLVTTVLFLVLWNVSPLRQEKIYFILFSSLGFLPFSASFPLVHALSQLYDFTQWGLDGVYGYFPGMIGGGIIGVSLISLVSRRWRHLRQEEDEQPPEVKEALERMKEGWGTAPQEARKQGFATIWFGLGVGTGVMGVAIILVSPLLFSVHRFLGAPISGLPEGPVSKIILLAFSLFMLLGGLVMFIYLPIDGLRSLRLWRKWRDQPEERLTIEGKIVGWWMNNALGDKTLLKIQRSNGSSKLLLVHDDLLLEDEEDESDDVRIEYLYGTEAVISVETLAPDEEESEAEGAE